MGLQERMAWRAPLTKTERRASLFANERAMVQKIECRSCGSNKFVATISVIAHSDVLMCLTSDCDRAITAKVDVPELYD